MKYDLLKAYQIFCQKEEREGREPLSEQSYLNVVLSLVEVLQNA